MIEQDLNFSPKEERPQKAWVVFTNQTDIGWIRILKKGYRHCFIVFHDDQNWISIDPMANYMEVICHHVGADFDLPEWLEGRGHKVIEANLTRDIKTSAPIMVFTCVEACKRFLGIHKIGVFTPWQLYRHLSPAPKKQRMSNIFKRIFHTIFHKGVFSWEV